MDKVGIARRSSIVFFSKVFSQMVNMISLMVLSRVMGFDEYASFRQFLVGLFTISTILNMGLPSSALYFLTGDKDRFRYTKVIYLTVMYIDLIILIASPKIIEILDNILNSHVFLDYSILFIVILPLQLIALLAINVFISFGEDKLILLFNLVPNLLYITGLFFLYIKLIKSSSIYNLLALKTFIAFLFAIIPFLKSRSAKIHFKDFVNVIRFSIPLGISNILGFLNSTIDKIMVSYFCSTKEFAIFVNGAYELPFLGLITSSLFNVSLSKIKTLYEMKDFEGLQKIWLKLGKSLMPVMIPLGIISMTFSDIIVTFLFSRAYIKSSFIFSIYQSTLLVRIYVYGILFIASGKSSLYMINAFLSFSINTFLNYVLIKLIGAVGASISTVISVYILYILQLIQISKILKTSIFKVYPFKEWILSIMISLSIAFVFKGLAWIIKMNYTFQLLLAGLSYFISFIVLSKLISNEILGFAKKIIANKLRKVQQ